MKSVRISDEAYKKIIKRSKKDKRTITATIDILISKAIDSEERAATLDTSPYSPIDLDSEPEPDVERKPIKSAWEGNLTLEEMRQMQQRMHNKAPNWATSDEE